jgi:hypothetical protein
VMFALSALAILPLPAVRPERVASSAGDAAGRAVHELVDQLREGMAFVRRHRSIAWSLAYLGISSSLIGVLGAIGPGFAVDILGLSSENFFFIMGPAGLGAVVGILFLNSYGKSIPKRLVIDVGLVAMGVTLVLLAVVKPVASVFGAATEPIEDAVPAIAPLLSLLAVVVVISVFAGMSMPSWRSRPRPRCRRTSHPTCADASSGSSTRCSRSRPSCRSSPPRRPRTCSTSSSPGPGYRW